MKVSTWFKTIKDNLKNAQVQDVSLQMLKTAYCKASQEESLSTHEFRSAVEPLMNELGYEFQDAKQRRFYSDTDRYTMINEMLSILSLTKEDLNRNGQRYFTKKE